MKSKLSRLDLYEYLSGNKEALLEEARRVGEALLVPSDLKHRLGPTGANSALPGTLRSETLNAIEQGMKKVLSPRQIGDEIRRVVKSVYGDEYDAIPTNSCESALLATYDALFTPPTIGAGEPYRSRVIGLYERHAEHHLSYGRPFPPRYKDHFADRGATAGELGLLGRVQYSTDCVIVPMAGAHYDLHGIKMHPTPLLMETDAERTIAAVEKAAEVHAQHLSGFITLGYDTIGYGYGEKSTNGTPLLQQRLGELAGACDLPYVADNAWGMPIIGADPRRLGADVMLYSMDKVAGSPTAGLIVGKEWPLVNIRRALGVHGERYGTTSAHGKGVHVHADPGKMTMLGVLHALQTLRDRPQSIKGPIDEIYEIVSDEYRAERGNLPDGLVITKSYNLGGVELNYERTWRDEHGNPRIGIPIFNNEDRVAGCNLLALALQEMGILPGPTDDGNILINPGLGTSDDDGNLIEEHMRLVVRALFRALSLLHDWGQRASTASV